MAESLIVSESPQVPTSYLRTTIILYLANAPRTQKRWNGCLVAIKQDRTVFTKVSIYKQSTLLNTMRDFIAYIPETWVIVISPSLLELLEQTFQYRCIYLEVIHKFILSDTQYIPQHHILNLLLSQKGKNKQSGWWNEKHRHIVQKAALAWHQML